MIYQKVDNKIITVGLEYSVSYHCNMRCSSCSHMAPFISKKFPSINSFEKDLRKLNQYLHTQNLRLVGGEPLLNPEVTEFIIIAKQSGIADTVMLTTNGLLLHKMKKEFWDHIDFISITLYPGYYPSDENFKQFKKIAVETNTKLRIFENPIFRTTIVTKSHPYDLTAKMIFKTCKSAHLYHCHMIHEGYLYKCACPPFLPEYLAKVDPKIDYRPFEDGFSIHQDDDPLGCQKYLLDSKTLNACRYCLGYVGKFQGHHQLGNETLKNPKLMNISRSNSLDKYKFFKESSRYFYRRGKEYLLNKQQW